MSGIYKAFFFVTPTSPSYLAATPRAPHRLFRTVGFDGGARYFVRACEYVTFRERLLTSLIDFALKKKTGKPEAESHSAAGGAGGTGMV